MLKRAITTIALLSGVAYLLSPFAFATDLTSTNFIVKDPIVGTGGGYSSSGSFKLFGGGDTTLTGYNNSLSFIGKYGFFYYPYATAGTLVATPSGMDVNLTWGATSAGQGFSVSGYNTGIANVSGGPYTYTSVGNVLLYTYSSLTPGTYYFVVQTLDAFGNVIATSNEATVTIEPTLTFAVSDASVGFGIVTPSSARYATPSGGSGTNTIAHTMMVSGNGTSGYTITYYGATLSSGGNTIDPATISSDADGSPGSEQFALSLSTSGGATIPSSYRQSSLNWDYADSTTTPIASTAGPTSSETLSFRYLTNTSSNTQSGQYTTAITYVLTGNF